MSDLIATVNTDHLQIKCYTHDALESAIRALSQIPASPYIEVKGGQELPDFAELIQNVSPTPTAFSEQQQISPEAWTPINPNAPYPHVASIPEPTTNSLQSANSLQSLESEAGYISDYHWALSRIRAYRSNDLEPSTSTAAFRDGDIARLICKLIEEPETLERSELYRQRIAGICTAAQGYGPTPDNIHFSYRTPAYTETHNLYCEYDKAYQALQKAGWFKNDTGDWVPRGTAEPKGIDALAGIYEAREHEDLADRVTRADAKVKVLADRLDLIHAVADAHGYNASMGPLPQVLKKWLDDFVNAENTRRAQAANLERQCHQIDTLERQVRSLSAALQQQGADQLSPGTGQPLRHDSLLTSQSFVGDLNAQGSPLAKPW